MTCITPSIVRSLADENQAKDSQQRGDGEHIEKEQNNRDKRAAALSGSSNLALGEVTNNDRDGPEERAK